LKKEKQRNESGKERLERIRGEQEEERKREEKVRKDLEERNENRDARRLEVLRKEDKALVAGRKKQRLTTEEKRKLQEEVLRQEARKKANKKLDDCVSITLRGRYPLHHTLEFVQRNCSPLVLQVAIERVERTKNGLSRKDLEDFERFKAEIGWSPKGSFDHF
jgi:hypothetical protein